MQTAETTPSPAFEVVDAVLERDGLPVLAGATLNVNIGEIVVLRGPNGAGKTTLLRAIAGLLPFASGSTSFAGEGEAQERCAYLGHKDAVKAALTGRENLEFWARLYGAKKGGTTDAARAFCIENIIERRAAGYSAGQRRRLALCRLVLSGKPVWLLDEPTASLDAEGVRIFASVIDRHCRNGGAAVIATHDALPFKGARNFRLGPEEAQ